MSDYTAEWPLWVGNGHINVTADPLGLSTALARRLWEWERLFDAHYSHETGWDSESARAEYAAQADVLFRDLRAELRPDVALSLDVWPLGEVEDPDLDD
jgi:hypothetical protein